MFPKLLLFPSKKWMNLISNQLSTASINFFNLPSPVFERFQNGYNKVVIGPRVVQFWSEIILVISNPTRAARSFNSEITPMISAQVALHSVQLTLFILRCFFFFFKISLTGLFLFSDKFSLISTSAYWWWFLTGCLCHSCCSHAVLPDGSFLLDACRGSLHLLICCKGVQHQL